MSKLNKHQGVPILRQEMAHLKRETGERGIFSVSADVSHPSKDTDKTSKALTKPSKDKDAVSSNVGDNPPIVDNDDPWKKRIFPGVGKWKRRINRIKGWKADLTGKDLSRDEKLQQILRRKRWDTEALQLYRDQKERQRLNKFHQTQAALFKKRISNVITDRWRLAYYKETEKGRQIKDQIWIDHIKYSYLAYFLHIGHFPSGVAVKDLTNPEICQDYSEACGHKVSVAYRDNGMGVVLRVDIASSMGIPESVDFLEMMERFPDQMGPLAFPAGKSTNANRIYYDLAEAPHMVIAGASGKGKSIFENEIIATIVHRNTPEVVRLVLFDLKAGTEFSAYRGLPHLYKLEGNKKKDGNLSSWSSDGIVEYPEDVEPALHRLKSVCYERLIKLKDEGKDSGKIFKNIGQYNRNKHPSLRMPYIVVVFDEWTVARTLCGQAVEDLLCEIANLSRAAGIHFIIAAQNPKADILNTKISVNFPYRVAFSMSSAASLALLSSWDAVGLGIPGRAIFQRPEDQITIQAPYISNNTILEYVSAATAGTQADGSKMTPVDMETILNWALDKNNRKLNFSSVYKEFRKKISYDMLVDLLKSSDGKEFDLSTNIYRVINHGVNKGGRVMELVNTGVSAEPVIQMPNAKCEIVLPENAEV